MARIQALLLLLIEREALEDDPRRDETILLRGILLGICGANLFYKTSACNVFVFVYTRGVGQYMYIRIRL
uniref:TM2 domain-containing protein n=1 Tax=Trichogramma kaykai TaxID=54128 RepID=A0ABD2WQZ1_9HYME